MDELEKEIVELSGVSAYYRFHTLGAWDSLRIIGITKSSHEFPKCIVCAILKCAKKPGGSVAAIHAVVIVDRDTYECKDNIQREAEYYLASCVVDGTIEIGPDATRKVRESKGVSSNDK